MDATRNVHRVNKMLPKPTRINMYNMIIVPCFDYCDVIFQQIANLNLKQRRKVYESVFIHKALTKKSTSNLHQEYCNHIPNTNTRNYTSGKLNIPKHNYSKFKKSPLYRTISTWNSIPSEIPHDSIKSHKTQYQNYLITQAHKK